MMMRFSLPMIQGRGAGLGNELFGWGKAYLAGNVLGIPSLPPAWGVNQRNYKYYFGTPPYLDIAFHKVATQLLPTYHFEHSDLLCDPDQRLSEAIKSFADRYDLWRRGTYVLEISGMWGGFECIAEARDFLRFKLLSARHSIENISKFNARVQKDAVRIGLHIRRGDFGTLPSDGTFQGKFNMAVPLEWYISALRAIKKCYPGPMEIVIISDASVDELLPLRREFSVMTTESENNRDISDLLVLSSCDLIVCSISSYSMWSVFFSNARYIWFRPNLTPSEGTLSIWGHEPVESGEAGLTNRARKHMLSKSQETDIVSRGVAYGWDGDLPCHISRYLEETASVKARESDLLRYGVIWQ